MTRPAPNLPDPTESRILAAARTVFTKKGTSGARMQDIAREAGVNQALLHYYFRTKAALSERVFLEAATRLFHAVVPPAQHPDTPLEAMLNPDEPVLTTPEATINAHELVGFPAVWTDEERWQRRYGQPREIAAA